jgi:hypothetical protein
VREWTAYVPVQPAGGIAYGLGGWLWRRWKEGGMAGNDDDDVRRSVALKRKENVKLYQNKTLVNEITSLHKSKTTIVAVGKER